VPLLLLALQLAADGQMLWQLLQDSLLLLVLSCGMLSVFLQESLVVLLLLLALHSVVIWVVLRALPQLQRMHVLSVSPWHLTACCCGWC
jgi:hypothetical protein